MAKQQTPRAESPNRFRDRSILSFFSLSSQPKPTSDIDKNGSALMTLVSHNRQTQVISTKNMAHLTVTIVED